MSDSPYHGAVEASLAYAFLGEPVTNIVNREGDILRIEGDACGVADSFDADCFVRDGMLGVRESEYERFLGVAEGGDPMSVVTLGMRIDGLLERGACREGCDLKYVDVERRLVTRRAEWPEAPTEVVRLRYDPWTGRAVVGYHTGERGFPSEYYGYVVEEVALD